MVTVLDIRGSTNRTSYLEDEEKESVTFILGKISNDEIASTPTPLIIEEEDSKTFDSWNVGTIYLTNIKTDEIFRSDIEENNVSALLKWLEEEDTEELARCLEEAYNERADFKLRY